MAEAPPDAHCADASSASPMTAADAERVVGSLLATLSPRRVIVACPGGDALVAAFAARGIEAAATAEDAFAETLPRRYDLVVCDAALLGASAEARAAAIRHIAAATEAVLFTPVSARWPPLRWMREFGAHGLWAEVRFDASFLAPQAMLLRAGEALSDAALHAHAETLRLRQRLAGSGLHEATRLELAIGGAAAVTLIERLNEASDIVGEQLRTAREQLAEMEALRARPAAPGPAPGPRLNPTAQASAAVRGLVAGLPAPVGRLVIAGARVGWWAATPHRMPARLRRLRARGMSPLGALRSLLAAPPHEPAPILTLTHEPPPAPKEEPRALERRPQAPVSTADILAERFTALRPLPVFAIDHGLRSRLTLVTDSIAADSFFGGVGTATILAALWARRRGAALRIVTLRAEPVRDNVAALLNALGVVPPEHVEFSHAALLDGGKPVDLGAEDIFLTTSWWSTVNTLGAVAPERVAYILQEDERMFYPLGDDWLRAQEVMGTPGLRRIVNTRLLHDHLAVSGIAGLDSHGHWFEPAFPEAAYYPDRAARKRLNLFFYARPNNPRNLYMRGMEALGAAIAQGVLAPQDWHIHFVGRDLPALVLPGGVPVTLVQGLSWDRYVALIRSMDLGLSLMLTPHPSYPPLDLVACGAVAVTNSFGAKQSLETYSENLICAEPSVEGLVEGLRRGVALARDGERRAANHARQGLQRSWTTAFASTLDWLEGA